MAHTLTCRLESLAAGASPPVVTIWTQDSGGADVFTCPSRPGVVLTDPEVRTFATGGGPGFSVIVVRVALTVRDLAQRGPVERRPGVPAGALAQGDVGGLTPA